MLLVIDNYDSFVFNLVQYLGQLGAECIVKRNDEVSVEEAGEYDGVLISPGPGTPEEAGISIAMIAKLAITVALMYIVPPSLGSSVSKATAENVVKPDQKPGNQKCR